MDQVKTGLPLFDWQRRSVDRIAVFPFARQTRRVRSFVAGLRHRSGEEAGAYWSSAMRQLDREMVFLGIDEVSRDREKWAFFDAVQMELDRMNRMDRNGAPISGAQ